MQKVLEEGKVKVSSVATDITGVSGRAILNALLAGEDDPQRLSELARGRMRSKREQLAQAVQGTLGEHHRFLLRSQLRQLDFLDAQIAELDHEIARRLGVQTDPEDPAPKGGEPTNGRNLAQTADLPAEAAQSRKPQKAGQEPGTRLSSTKVIRILDEVTGINGRIAKTRGGRTGHPCRPFPERGSSGLLGGAVSSRQDQCRQTLEHQDGQREPLAATGTHRGRARSRTQQRNLPGGLLPTTHEAHG